MIGRLQNQSMSGRFFCPLNWIWSFHLDFGHSNFHFLGNLCSTKSKFWDKLVAKLSIIFPILFVYVKTLSKYCSLSNLCWYKIIAGLSWKLILSLPRAKKLSLAEFRTQFFISNIYTYIISITAQKIKFFIKDFFSKCDHIHSFLAK